MEEIFNLCKFFSIGKCEMLIRGQAIFITSFLSYFLHNTMNTFDPGLQITESYTWIFNIFKWTSIFLVLSSLVILLKFAVHIWVNWPSLIDRHKTTFLFSVFFMFSLNFILLNQGELTFFETSRGCLFALSLANFYVAALMYLFSISDEGMKELSELRTLDKTNEFQKVSVIDEDDSLTPGH